MTMVGADVGQLRQFGKALASGAERIDQAAAVTTQALARTKWVGPDANEFRQRWNASLKGQLGNAASRLRAAATEVTAEADEQERASDGGGSLLAAGGGGGTPPGECAPLPIPDAAAALPAWGPYQGAAVLAGTVGLGSSLLLNAMGNAGLVGLTRAGYGFQLAATADDVAAGLRAYQVGRGVQTLNAGNMLGRAFGWLGVGTGAIQIAQGIACGDGYATADGVVTTVLAGASLIPGPVGWVAAGLSVGWGVASMLSGDVPVTKRITDGLSSAWNWLTGG